MIDKNRDMRFMTNNFLETGYAALDISSTKVGYSSGDMIDPSQRTKVFKFGGRFLIEADVNDKFYINGNTYSIPADDYASGEILASVMTSYIGGAVYVFYSEFSKEFSITGDSGAVTLNLSNTTNAIWETLGYTTGVDTGPHMIGVQVFANMVRSHWPHEEIFIDFGYSAPIGFIGMVTDLAEEFKIPQGAEIRIQANTVNSFIAPPLDQIIPVFKTGAFKFIDDVEDSVWRYVKITIKCPTFADTPEIGYLYIGDYSTFPERNIETGFEHSHDDSSLLSRADDGQIYANDRTPVRRFQSMEVGLARPECAAFLKNVYKKKQLSVPFFVAIDPTEYLSESFDEYIALVRLESPPKYKHILKDFFQMSFELKEAI